MGQQGLAAEGPEEVPWLRGWPSQQVGEVLPQVQDEPGALPSCWQGGSHYGEEPLRSHADSRSSGQACWQGGLDMCKRTSKRLETRAALAARAGKVALNMCISKKTMYKEQAEKCSPTK